MNDRALIVFSKVPRKGQVKTRLAADIGEERALECFVLLLERCLSEAGKVPARRYLFLAPPDWHDQELGAVEHLLPGFEIRAQEGGDLGARMSRAFSQVVAMGFRAVVGMGTDIPFLAEADIQRAFSFLDTSDIIIGPARDGGYYLLGMRQGLNRWESLFSGIPWGSGTVLEETCRRAQSLGLRIARGRPLDDVDVLADVRRWRERETDPVVKRRLMELFSPIRT